MSVYTHAIVRCDYRDPETGWQSCHSVVEEGFTKREGRAAARTQGWTCVRSPLGRAFDKDYCPDHKPAAEGSQP